jgi:hypothetical protein
MDAPNCEVGARNGKSYSFVTFFASMVSRLEACVRNGDAGTRKASAGIRLRIETRTSTMQQSRFIVMLSCLAKMHVVLKTITEPGACACSRSPGKQQSGIE